MNRDARGPRMGRDARGPRMTRSLRELAAAVGLLTRVPLGRWLPAPDDVDHGAAVWAYPVVGLAIGAASGLAYAAAIRLGATPFLAAVWALLVGIILTGALHEDGLADSADGLGGGRDAAHRLAIMRDSRIGTYGALALGVSLLLRVTAIAAIGGPGRVVMALMVAGALGRLAILVILRRAPSARADGLAASLGTVGRTPMRLAALIAAASVVVLVRFRLAVWLFLITVLLALAWARLVRRSLDGYTGDTLGAIEIMVECVVLTMLAAR